MIHDENDFYYAVVDYPLSSELICRTMSVLEEIMYPLS